MEMYLLLLILGNLATPASAQPVTARLDEDPVFSQVLAKRLSYPTSFEYFPVYGRVYVGFHVNEKGRIENILILSPGNSKSGFEYQVVQALKHEPSLNPRYEGDYVLPVAFCYRNRATSSSFSRPVNRLSEDRMLNRQLLTERECLFDWSPTKTYAEPQEVWGFYTKNSR